MDSPPGRKQLTHDRIVRTAAQAIRGAGFHGVGVADIMKRAGLTHGGFYAHFASRDELLAEALAQAGRDGRERLEGAMAPALAKGQPRLRAFIDNYLAERHLRAADTGCPVAALCSEMPRQAPAVRQAGARSVKSLIAQVGEMLGPDAPADAAATVAAQMVGALQLARALGDNAQGRAVLAATRRALLDRFDPPPAR
jgi:AcrR family transcriptional regulator